MYVVAGSFVQCSPKRLPFTNCIHEHVPATSHSTLSSGGNAFADLLDDDEEEAEEPASAPASSKSKKKKKEKAAKSAFSGLMSDDDADEDISMAPEPEVEVNLVTTPVDSLVTIEQVTAALAATGISKTRKQGLKQRLKSLEVRYSCGLAACVRSRWSGCS